MTTPSSQPPSNFQQFLFKALTLAGVPLGGFGVAYLFTQSLWQGLLVAVILVTLGFFVRVASKAFGKLEDKCAERLAEWVDTSIGEMFSGYRRKYCEHLKYQHRVFDVKGLSTQGIFSLELEQVFVELSIAPQPANSANTNPLHPPSELGAGAHTLWEYANAPSWHRQHFAVIGPPGSGKTTLLKHAALTLAGGNAARHRFKAPDKLPVLLFLRQHAESISTDAQYSLAQAIRDSLQKQDGPVLPPNWFERQLASGRCWIMLDGLDEVADEPTRKLVATWVENKTKAHGKNRFILTSRPFGYKSNPVTGVAVLEVCNFTGEQIKKFIENWYLANEIMSMHKDDPGVRLVAKQGAQDLLTRLEKAPPLNDLAVNPLLLAMITNVHRYRGSLPGRRVELYSEICEVFLGKRQQARGLDLDLTPAQKLGMLRPLAWQMMMDGVREIRAAEAIGIICEPLARTKPQIKGEDFLKEVENSSGLLIENENGIYSFSHLTFQEYLAGSHALEKNLVDDLTAQVDNGWWHETLRLYCAQADASPIVTACLRNTTPSVPGLKLAFECAEEAKELAPELRSRVEQLETEGVEHPDDEIRRVVAEATLARRLSGRTLHRLDEDRWIDTTLVTHAEYQLFLDEQRAQGRFYEPDHWNEARFPQGQGSASVVGVRSTDAAAFCEWLTARSGSGWRYRPPTTREARVVERVEESAQGWIQSVQEWHCSMPKAIAKLNTVVITSIWDTDIARALKGKIDFTDHRRASDLTRARELDLDLIGLRDRARALDRSLILPLIRDRVRDHDLDFIGILDHTLKLAHEVARTHERNLAHGLTLVRDRNYSLSEDRRFLRWYLRLSALLADGNRLKANKYVFLDLYLTLAMVEERAAGRLQAFEGIRIVKERQALGSA